MKKLIINSDGKIEVKIKPSKQEIIAAAIKRAEILRLAKEEMEKGNYYV